MKHHLPLLVSRSMNQLKRKSQECLLGALKNTLRLKGHCASSSSKQAKKDHFNEVTTIQKSPVAPGAHQQKAQHRNQETASLIHLAFGSALVDGES